MGELAGGVVEPFVMFDKVFDASDVRTCSDIKEPDAAVSAMWYGRIEGVFGGKETSREVTAEIVILSSGEFLADVMAIFLSPFANRVE